MTTTGTPTAGAQGSPRAHSDLRNRAQAVSDTLAERLRDPAEVAERVARGHWIGTVPQDLAYFGRGHSGISLLFSKRATRVPDEAVAAYRHLQRNGALLSHIGSLHSGMYTHLAGMGFAMAIAQSAAGGYAKALRRIDDQLSSTVHSVSAGLQREPLADLSQWDVINGITGMGRFLLARGDLGEPAATVVLDTLADLVLRRTLKPRPDSHADLPGLWATGSPSPSVTSPDVTEYGHLNLGLAHGITGPLALLALAELQGRADATHAAAGHELADLLLSCAQDDGQGPFWPVYVTRTQWQTGRAEPAPSLIRWCYGSLGIARALQLAGAAYGRSDCSREGDRAIEAMLAAPLHQWDVVEMGLCHGWAGVLQILSCFTDSAVVGERVRAVTHRIADLLVDAFDDDVEFGYRVPLKDGSKGEDDPGFLGGATGIALALDDYANGRNVSAVWDAALLIA